LLIILRNLPANNIKSQKKMDRKLQAQLKKIYEKQAEMAQGYGRVAKPKKAKKATHHAAHHMAGGMVGGMYHPYMHPHMAAMYGMGLEYMHPPHPYHMMAGHGLVGGNVHHRHHVPAIHEAHHPSAYAMFVKANNAKVRHALSGSYTGRELNKAVFRELGRMWAAHK
jgi:hypothetical protein